MPIRFLFKVSDPAIRDGDNQTKPADLGTTELIYPLKPDTYRNPDSVIPVDINNKSETKTKVLNISETVIIVGILLVVMCFLGGVLLCMMMSHGENIVKSRWKDAVKNAISTAMPGTMPSGNSKDSIVSSDRDRRDRNGSTRCLPSSSQRGGQAIEDGRRSRGGIVMTYAPGYRGSSSPEEHLDDRIHPNDISDLSHDEDTFSDEPLEELSSSSGQSSASKSDSSTSHRKRANATSKKSSKI